MTLLKWIVAKNITKTIMLGVGIEPAFSTKSHGFKLSASIKIRSIISHFVQFWLLRNYFKYCMTKSLYIYILNKPITNMNNYFRIKGQYFLSRKYFLNLRRIEYKNDDLIILHFKRHHYYCRYKSYFKIDFYR